MLLCLCMCAGRDGLTERQRVQREGFRGEGGKGGVVWLGLQKGAGAAAFCSSPLAAALPPPCNPVCSDQQGARCSSSQTHRDRSGRRCCCCTGQPITLNTTVAKLNMQGFNPANPWPNSQVQCQLSQSSASQPSHRIVGAEDSCSRLRRRCSSKTATLISNCSKVLLCPQSRSCPAVASVLLGTASSSA